MERRTVIPETCTHMLRKAATRGKTSGVDGHLRPFLAAFLSHKTHQTRHTTHKTIHREAAARAYRERDAATDVERCGRMRMRVRVRVRGQALCVGVGLSLLPAELVERALQHRLGEKRHLVLRALCSAAGMERDYKGG